MIQTAFNSITVIPTSFIAQESFRQTVTLIEVHHHLCSIDVCLHAGCCWRTARKRAMIELSARTATRVDQDAKNAKREWTATQKTKALLGTIQHRAEAVFRLLNLQVTLCLLSREPDVTHVRAPRLRRRRVASRCMRVRSCRFPQRAST
jgi:hypothetical protein